MEETINRVQDKNKFYGVDLKKIMYIVYQHRLLYLVLQLVAAILPEGEKNLKWGELKRCSAVEIALY